MSIYDAATGGKLLYTENIGDVTLDSTGGYSYNLEGLGMSIVNKTEFIDGTSDTATVYSKILSDNALNNTVTITDGAYNWSQISGPDSPTNFTGSYDSGSGTVSAIYLSGTPPAGRTITASYDRQVDGIVAALSQGSEHWLELSVDGSPQPDRDRLLPVPFAFRAVLADNAAAITVKTNKTIHVRTPFFHSKSQYSPSQVVNSVSIPYTLRSYGGLRYSASDNLRIPIDPYRVSKIHQIRANVDNNLLSLYNLERSYGRCTIKLYQVNDSGPVLLTSQMLEKVPGNIVIDHPVSLDEKYSYFIEVTLSVVGIGNNDIVNGTECVLNSIEILCDRK